MDGLYQTQRIKDLKDKMLSEPRYASIEQALIITKTYQENEDAPRIFKGSIRTDGDSCRTG